jgi:hypothetical protein
MQMLSLSSILNPLMSSHFALGTTASSIHLPSFPAGTGTSAFSSRNNGHEPVDSPSEDAQDVQPQRTLRARSCTSMIKDQTIRWKLFNLTLSTVLLLINLSICKVPPEYLCSDRTDMLRYCFCCCPRHPRALALHCFDLHTLNSWGCLVSFSLSLDCSGLSVSKPRYRAYTANWYGGGYWLCPARTAYPCYHGRG